ncbi:MAG TPA: hypothetical protein VIH31_00050 [Candidatus Paceibacterota bacterium]
MSQKSLNLTAGIIFTLIAVLHLIRSILGWEAVIGGISISIGVSVIAFLVATFLAYSAFRLNNKQ